MVSDPHLAEYLARNASVIFFKCSDDRSICFLNRAWEEILGYATAECLDRKLEEFVHPEDRETFLAIFAGVEASADSRKDLRFIHRDGSARWMLLSVAAVNGFFRVGSMENVTKRRNAEEALRESVEMFGKLTEAAFEGVVITIGGKIVEASENFAAMFGYAPSEMPGKTALDLTAPEYREFVMEKILSNYDKAYEAVAVRRDGTRFPFESHGRMINYKGKKARVAAIRDITDRKKAEEALRESEEKYRTLMNDAVDAIIINDFDGRMLEANKKALSLGGYEKKDVLGRHFLEFIRVEEKDRGIDAFREIMETGSSPPTEFTLIGKDGVTVPIEISGSIVEYQGKKVVQGIIRDITERKRAKDELRAQKDFISAVLDTVSSVLIVLDTEGRYVRVNRSFEEQSGFSADEVIGRYFWDVGVLPPEMDAASAREMYRKLLKGPFPLYFEQNWLRKNGECRLVAYFNSPIYAADGSVRYIVAAGEDITDRRNAENELLAAKKRAEDATVLKDKFVSLVSHDLKAPLSAMLGFLKLLRDESAEPLREWTASILRAGIESGEKMNELIDELLTIGRIKTGKIVPKLRFVDFHNLAMKILEEMRASAERKGVVLVNRIPVPFRIYCDTALMRQVLLNVVSNSVKFCRKGDTVTVSASGGAEHSIEIADTGVGIDGAKLKDIFDYSKKTTTPGTAGETGTGLGLPLAADILDAHGGSITAESTLGKGSRFTLCLPVMRPVVLLVDDEKPARDLYRAFLRRLDVNVVEAETGEEALKLVQKTTPNLIILDLLMPIMDGMEVLRRLRSDPRTADVPVIVLTVDGSMETRENVFRMGGNDYMHKSVEMADFLPRVNRYLG